MLRGGEDKQQHNTGTDIPGDCRGYGGSMEPICNLNLEDLERRHDRHELEERSILARLRVLNDLAELAAE